MNQKSAGVHEYKKIEERIKGGMLGLIVGDALGVPYEFNPPKNIPSYHEIEYIPPKYFEPSYPGVRPGTWSDDSAQALCLLDSLLECDGFNLDNFAQKLLLWYREGLWAVDNEVFDCGIQTRASLRELSRGVPASECGFARPDGKGNGALMRVLPLVLWHHQGEREQLIKDAHAQCLITHGHICNQVCCAFYCLWGKELLCGREIVVGYNNAVEILKKFYEENQLVQYLYELEMMLQDGNFSGGGFVVDSMRSVKHLLFHYQSYESVVKEAIRLGNDTDTTAAIAGGLAGLVYGYSGIPKRWILGLRDINKVEDAVKLLCDSVI